MNMDLGTASAEDLDRLERQVRKWRIEREMGIALSRDDFWEWARLGATWLLDRFEDAWNWLRRAVRLV